MPTIQEKIDLARSLGIPDDLIQQRIKSLQPTQQQPKRDIISSILPAAGSIVGGILGAPLGPAGIIGGSAIGGGLGEAGAQRRAGEQISAGKIAKEAALGGAFAGAGEAFSALRGARAAGQAGKAAAEAEPTLVKAGQAIKKGIIKPRVAASASSAARETQLVSDAEKLGLKGSAQAMREQSATLTKQLGEQIEAVLSKTKAVIPRQAISQGLEAAFKESININPAVPVFKSAIEKQVTPVLEKLGEKPSAKPVFDTVKSLNAKLAPAFKKIEMGAPLTPDEEVAITIRGVLDNLLAEKVPEVKRLKLQQSTLEKLAPGLKVSAQQKVRVPVAGVAIPGGTAVSQTAQDLVARGLIGGGRTAQTIGKSPASRVIAQQLVGRGAEAISRPPQPAQPSVTAADIQLPAQQLGLAGALPATPKQTIPQENVVAAIIADIQATGGKNISKITAIAEALNKGTGQKLTGTQIKDVNNAQSGLNAIQTIRQELQNVSSFIALNQANLPDIFGGNQVLASSIREAADIITRLRTGAAINKSEERFYRSQLPKPTDSERTIQHKLQTLEGLFTSIAQQSTAPQEAVLVQ